MPIADVLVSKLLALNERWLDYDQLLQMGRATREQIDWDEVRRRTAESPFARAFFEIVDGLGISGDAAASPSGTRDPTTER
jgi:hypothetical protein